jgi:hypothetical protein
MTAAPPFGPWQPGLDPIERVAELRCLAGLAAVYAGSSNPIVAALRAAEQNSAALAHASDLLDKLPSLRRRRILATGARRRPRRPMSLSAASF